MSTKSSKTIFARRFLRSLSEIGSTNKGAASNSVEEARKRSQRIKMAAYSSMAAAVGSKRAWSRALLIKLRKNGHGFGMTTKKYRLRIKQKKMRIRAKAPTKTRPMMRSQIGKLRELVPGGETMDICRLLEETAHYVKCLTTQVKVMQTIADHLSPPNKIAE